MHQSIWLLGTLSFHLAVTETRPDATSKWHKLTAGDEPFSRASRDASHIPGMTDFLPFSEGSPPFVLTVAPDAGSTSKTPRLGHKEWNALIGIVTAIVGNVLISFALNLQRYAHIRLNRNKLRRSRSWKSKKKLRNAGDVPASYGAEEAGERNGRPASRSPGPGQREDDETSPFGGRSHRSASTDRSDGQDDEEEEGKSYLRSPLWWLGISLMTVGEAGNFLA